jgi:hypothetical protein
VGGAGHGRTAGTVVVVGAEDDDVEDAMVVDLAASWDAAGCLSPLSGVLLHAAIERVRPTGLPPVSGPPALRVRVGFDATPMVANRPASNAYSEVDAIRPWSPSLPADSALTAVVTERMGAE